METLLPRRYRIIRVLGRGGQGAVWLASDRLHGEARVALKVIPGLAGRGGGPEELAREFLTLLRLAHPCIGRVRDFGYLPGGRGAYFTSDYVPGGNLLEWASNLPAARRWQGLVAVAAQALSALRYLAHHGVRHGDVKPTNLLVEGGAAPESEPSLRLIDFGAAKLQGSGSALERLGTPAYLPPPELLGQGDGGSAGQAALDPDLYGLGMSLYHAACGRLPFPLGDEAELHRWWRARKPARILEAAPLAPPLLDSLVAGLTATGPPDRFRSAADALELLRAKASLAPLPPRRGEAAAWVPGREELILGLVQALTRPTCAPRVHAIVAPRGSGKTRALEAADSCLQVQGYRTVLFSGFSDSRALGEVRDLALEVSGPRLPGRGGGLEAAELVEVLSGLRVAVLLDEGAAPDGGAPGQETTAVLRGLASAALSVQAGARGPVLLCATASPERLAGDLAIAPERLETHALEPLSEAAIAEAARDYFEAEGIPQGVIERIARESRGLPGRVREALEALAAAGASTDLLGCLKVPPALPVRLVSPDQAGPGEDLSPTLARALGLLCVAGEPLDAVLAATAYPELSPEEWLDRLEALRWRGLLRREDREPRALYHVAEAAAPRKPARLLGKRGEAEAREGLAGRHRALLVQGTSPRPERLLAAARNLIALGRPREAARFALRARRKVTAGPGGREHANVLIEVLDSIRTMLSGTGATDRRPRAVLELRLAEVRIRLGRFQEALDGLRRQERLGFEARARWLRGEARERLGDIEGAISELLPLEGATPQDGPEGPLGDPVVLEAKARLAPLYFRAGRPAGGTRCLRAGRELLGPARRAGGLPSARRRVAVHSLFAAAEAVHGQPEAAMEHLEAALGIAREHAWRDLAWGPLNELGILYAQHQKWPEALHAFEEIEIFARRHGDRLATLRAAYNRAIIHYRVDDLDEAEALFREARSLSDSLGRHALASAVWLGFASVLRERGRLLEALRLYRKVLRPSAGSRPNDRAVAHNNVAEVYLRLGRLSRAHAHVCLAFRSALRTRNRFLLGLALRTRGMVRFALGRAEAAGRDLERARQLAAREGDQRAAADASYWCGLLAGARGDSGTGIRLLRASRAAARSARDPRILEASTLALLLELSSRGRRKAARAFLDREAPRAASSDLARRILEARTSPAWPSSWEEAVRTLRDEVRSGRLWDAFWLLSSVLGERGLPPAARGGMLLERELLALRLLRGLPGRSAERFCRFWAVARGDHDETSASAGEGAAAPARPAAEGRQPSGLSARIEALVLGETRIEGLLEEVKRSLGAGAAWVLQDPSLDPKGHVAQPGTEDGLRAFLARRRREIERARKDRGVVECAPYLLVKLPHPSSVRVLCVEGPRAGWADPRGAISGLLEAAAVLALAFEILEYRATIESERERHDGARDEARRLSALVVKERKDLETALITRRLELLEPRDGLELRPGEVARRRPILGKSAAMEAIRRRIAQLAPRELPILILGESGVGKDLIARQIHDQSPRQSQPFLAELCNVPESLMEAELFGYVRGAFTGADEDRPGQFERAQGGTIYLDEIADLAPTLQARLLRVLEDKTVRPVGAAAARGVDFRLISSSTSSLAALEASATLRKDFLYRVRGELIEVPPLRERREDIPVIVERLLLEYARETGRPTPAVHARATERLLAHAWPGNVRELVNEVRRALLDHPVEITADMLRLESSDFRPSSVAGDMAPLPPLREERLRVERELIRRALEAHGGNTTRAARALRITRRYLTKLVGKHALELEHLRARTSRRTPPP